MRVRFGAHNGLTAGVAPCPFCAMNGLSTGKDSKAIRPLHLRVRARWVGLQGLVRCGPNSLRYWSAAGPANHSVDAADFQRFLQLGSGDNTHR